MNHILYKLSIIFISVLLWYWFFGSVVIHDIYAAKQLQKQYQELGNIYKTECNTKQNDISIQQNPIPNQLFLASLYKGATQYKIKICSIEKKETRIVQQTIQQTDYECVLEGPYSNLHTFITNLITHNQACGIYSLIVSAGGGDQHRTISMKVRYLCTI